ncbi:MAG: ATP-binding protein [Nitrospiraceae bacterium]|nr:MAG: ATP-binding protein [Nitrospiraceae bacterium]
MDDFEKLGKFYLGREYDLVNKKQEALLLYDSKDLTTHAVCVGMTGSGKTGLCIGLLEEAAIDGIPSLVIDPKGDLSNLLLSFPELKSSDFLPWINKEDAQKKDLTPEDFARYQAELWKKGLAEWGQDGSRISRLKDAAEFCIYTPGSTAGISVSILKSFESPHARVLEDSDLLRERINTTVTSLLNMIGVEADPIQSREHILLATILESAWKEGTNLDLGSLIQSIQEPPVNRIGVFDMDSFFPSKERFSLAMQLNNLLAAPGFSVWLDGEPLDIGNMLYTVEGKPKVSIFSIAHLNDAERMFFVSLLLTQVLGWIRTQSGTTSLRALLYMDEIFGYFPPVANPPSKEPLLTLLKQARAFGLGIVLATQNPVDLDYKGLSNTGTWFIGRLQTDRDKERVLDGLEGAGSSAGGRFDRQKMEQTLAGLGKRIFLMNNVHEDEPVIFQTRWVLSYLRGPLTREEIKRIMKGVTVSDQRKPVEQAAIAVPKKKRVRAAKGSSRPVLPPEIPQYFIPLRGTSPEDADVIYEPMLMGIGTTYFAHAKDGIAIQKTKSLLAEFSDSRARMKWTDAEEISLSEDDLEKFPEDEEALFGKLSKGAGLKKNYSAWEKEFKDWLYRTERLKLLKSPLLKIVSEPDESERDFRIRLQTAAHEKRDILVERIKNKYAAKIARLEERIRKAHEKLEREKEQTSQQKLQTAISFGATVLSALMGRKKVSRSSLGRAATTAGRAGRILKEKKDVQMAKEKIQELEQRLSELRESLVAEAEEIKTAVDPLTEKLDTITIKPKKMDISIALLALVWVPYWKDKKGGLLPSYR